MCLRSLMEDIILWMKSFWFLFSKGEIRLSSPSFEKMKIHSYNFHTNTIIQYEGQTISTLPNERRPFLRRNSQVNEWKLIVWRKFPFVISRKDDDDNNYFMKCHILQWGIFEAKLFWLQSLIYPEVSLVQNLKSFINENWSLKDSSEWEVLSVYIFFFRMEENRKEQHVVCFVSYWKSAYGLCCHNPFSYFTENYLYDKNAIIHWKWITLKVIGELLAKFKNGR